MGCCCSAQIDHLVERLMFQPPRPPEYSRNSFGSTSARLLWVSDDLPALLLPHSRAQYLVLMCHGNACDLRGALDEVQEYQKHFSELGVGIHFLCAEIPGYGLASGGPTERATNAATKATYEYAVGTLKVPPARIIVWGRSIGSGPATELAATLPPDQTPAALVLFSAFTSIKDIGRELREIRWLAYCCDWCTRNHWVSVERIKRVACPAIFIHGKDDGVIGCHHSERLSASCTTTHKALHVMDGADHNEFNEQLVCKFVADLLEKSGKRFSTPIDLNYGPLGAVTAASAPLQNGDGTVGGGH